MDENKNNYNDLASSPPPAAEDETQFRDTDSYQVLSFGELETEEDTYPFDDGPTSADPGNVEEVPTTGISSAEAEKLEFANAQLESRCAGLQAEVEARQQIIADLQLSLEKSEQMARSSRDDAEQRS